MKEILEDMKSGVNLSKDKIEFIFDKIFYGELEEEEISQILLYLSNKGETAEEIAASINTAKKHADTIDIDFNILDTCGTGGDGKSTFNISTAAAIVCSLYVPVAKHGNRAVSSKSGSADVLDALGIPINLNKHDALKHLKENNFVFLFAQIFHPSMRYVASVRKKLGVRTVFNIMGPFLNPFNPTYQLIGVFDKEFLPILSEVSQILLMDNVMLVSSYDGMDEISISDKSIIYYKKGLNNRIFEFDPMDFKIHADISAVKGFDSIKNAEIMYRMFEGGYINLINAVAINAAFALVCADVESDLRKSFILAKESILSKKALDKLIELSKEGKNDIRKCNR